LDLYTLCIPDFLESPWAGKSIEFCLNGELEVRISEGNGKSQMGSIKLRDLPVPRVKLKNGKEQNIWSINRYLSLSSHLDSLLDPLAPADRAKALEYIMGPAIRVLGGIEWAQGAEYPHCSECAGKMKFIMQVSGTWFPKRVNFNIHESEIYIFGCEKNPEHLQKVVQFY
jgi:hypothetical protein